MKITIIKDYQEIAERLRVAAGVDKCKIKVIDAEKNHFHFGMYNKNDQHIALICYKDGNISISPFKSVNAIVREDQFIPMRYIPIADEFCKVFMGLRDFLVEKGENGDD